MNPNTIPALVLAAAMAAAPASALAGKVPEAADQGQGMALLGAMVSPQGEFYPRFSSGVVSSQRTAVGRYEIKFNRSLYGCTPVVSALQAMLVEYELLDEDGDEALMGVRIYDRTGAAADSAVTVFYFCSR